MASVAALHRKLQDRILILGVSLDLVPDEHGHVGGHAEDGQAPPGGDAPARHSSPANPERLRETIARTVRARNVSYLILLDEHGLAGARYHGAELPTTVIVDARGLMRRRFVGAHSPEVLEAIIREALQGWTAAADRGTDPLSPTQPKLRGPAPTNPAPRFPGEGDGLAISPE